MPLLLMDITLEKNGSAHIPVIQPTHHPSPSPSPQILPPRHYRRVRQVRRVDLEFLPRGRPLFAPNLANSLPVKFERVSIKAGRES